VFHGKGLVLGILGDGQHCGTDPNGVHQQPATAMNGPEIELD